MVKVGVSQQNSIELINIHWQGLPIAFTQPLVTLIQTAIDQNFCTGRLYQVFRAGNGFRTAQKGDFHVSLLTSFTSLVLLLEYSRQRANLLR